MAGPRNSRTTTKGRVYTWPRTNEEFRSVTTLMGDGVPKHLTDWAGTMGALCAYNRTEALSVLRAKGGALRGDYHAWKKEWWEELESYDRGQVADWASFILKGGDANEVPDDYARLVAIHLVRNAHLRDRDAAANQGSKVHNFAERITLGIASMSDVPPQLVGHVSQFMRFIDEWQPQFEATEMTVYSRKHRYAGTLDFIARLPGLGLCLGDYKTNRTGLYGDVALQLAAYRYADFIGLPDNSEVPMMEVDNCVGIHISAEDYSVIPVKADQTAFETFLAATQIAEWANNGSKSALGAPLPQPTKVAS